MTTSGSGLSVPSDPKLPSATKFPVHPQPFDIPDIYVEQICLRREWEGKMEKLNEKYGLDYISDLELDSKSYEGENHQYEQKYETLI